MTVHDMIWQTEPHFTFFFFALP